MPIFTRSEKKLGAKSGKGETLPLKVLHRMECKACPLDKVENFHPKMAATGSNTPTVYILGEAPGREEDEQGKQFVGDSGKYLRQFISKDWLPEIRWNNCVRTRPPGNRTPVPVEIECCRPSIVRDIEATKPKVIFGFGAIPLKWVTEQSGITGWRGRKMPVTIGSHTCWFYVFHHPSFVMRRAKGERDSNDQFTKEWEYIFERDIKRALGEVDNLPLPVVFNDKDVYSGVELVHASQVPKMLEAFSELEEVGIDYETTKVRPYSAGAKILTCSIGTDEYCISFAVDHSKSKATREETIKVKEALKRFLLSRCKKIAHNAPFEMEWSAYFFGDEVLYASDWVCTQVQSYILDDRAQCQSLEALCILHFGYNVKKKHSLSVDLDREPLSDVLLYNSLDTKFAYKLKMVQSELIRSKELESVEQKHQRELIPFVRAQLRGFDVDQEVVKKTQKELDAKIKPVLSDVQNNPDLVDYRKRFGEFNPTSPKNLVYLFRDVLGRTEGVRGKKYSTDKEVLESINHPIAKQCLEIRRISKLQSTYVDPYLSSYPDSVVYPDGKVHTKFNTTFTASGRTSSDGPNLQNLPKRRDSWVRKMFVPPPGSIIVAVDYGQIEARVLGMVSRDKVLCDALWTDFDIHQYWAEKIVVADKTVLERAGSMKEVRYLSKNKFVFPNFYGAKTASVARNLQILERVCRELQDEFWDDFKDVLKMQKEQKQFYLRNGYVECLTGLRRYGPLTENMIINTPIQGLASEIVVDAMRRLSDRAFKEENENILPRINVHDDLTFVVRKPRLDESVEIIVTMMCNTPFRWVNVPISVEVSIGENWGEMEEIGKFRSDKL